MTIIAETETTATAVDSWCTEVRRLHEAHAHPITDPNDPRVAEFIRACGVEESSPTFARNSFHRDVKEFPEHAGERYFEKCVQLPPIPVSGPAWAVRHEVTIPTWPIVEVEFISDELKVGEVVAWASRLTTIQVAATHDAPAPTIRTEDEETDITVVVDGHPIDFYGASLRSVQQAAAALLMVAVHVGEGMSK